MKKARAYKKTGEIVELIEEHGLNVEDTDIVKVQEGGANPFMPSGKSTHKIVLVIDEDETPDQTRSSGGPDRREPPEENDMTNIDIDG